MPLPLRLLLLATLVLLAPCVGAQTCSDGTWGVRTSVRTEVSGDTLRLCIALTGDPTETVGFVTFRVHHTLSGFAAVGWENAAPASSPFNQPPYGTGTFRCLASPQCDDNFIAQIDNSSGPHRPFPTEPVDVVCPTFVLSGPPGSAGVVVRGVQARNGAGADVAICPPQDQAAWGVPVTAEEGPTSAGPALTIAPNPLRGTAAVGFTLPAAGPVRLALLDALGREVAVLAEGVRSSGEHRVALAAARLPAGAYLLRLEAGAEVAVRRVTVVR